MIRISYVHNQNCSQIQRSVPSSHHCESQWTLTSLMSSWWHENTNSNCLLETMSILNNIEWMMLPLSTLGNEKLSGNTEKMDVCTMEDKSAMFPFTKMFDVMSPHYPMQLTSQRTAYNRSPGTYYRMRRCQCSLRGVHLTKVAQWRDHEGGG